MPQIGVSRKLKCNPDRDRRAIEDITQPEKTLPAWGRKVYYARAIPGSESEREALGASNFAGRE